MKQLVLLTLLIISLATKSNAGSPPSMKVPPQPKTPSHEKLWDFMLRNGGVPNSEKEMRLKYVYCSKDACTAELVGAEQWLTFDGADAAFIIGLLQDANIIDNATATSKTTVSFECKLKFSGIEDAARCELYVWQVLN